MTDQPAAARQPLIDRPFIRTGIYAWAAVGILAVLVALTAALGVLTVIWVPLLLALFPAALLAPVAERLKRAGTPPALAALATLLGFLALIALLVGVLVPIVAAELPTLTDSFRSGLEDLRSFLERTPLNVPSLGVDEMLEQGRQLAMNVVRRSGTDIATAVAEGVTGLLLGLLALFFYLKDGERLAAGLRDTFPRRLREDVAVLGGRAWWTLGAYFRGQLLIAFVDAVFIGIGLAVLGVPLALPLAVLVFFGGLFPIVGAFISGSLAVLVALADQGPVIALAALAVVIGVQQLESNILEPVVLSRAVHLHPLVVIAALTTGGVTLGILGAFLSVPVAASIARAVDHLRDRSPAPA